MSSLLYLASYLDLPLRKMRHVFAGLILMVGVGLITPPAGAQYDTGSVVGTIADPFGAVVAGADIALRNTDLGTTLTRKSNSHGEYEFPDVQIGTYTVTVNAPGFAESVTKPFQLVVSARQQINVPLKLGIANETVTVNVDDAALQKESGERSTTIENEQIIDLPLNGREYSDLALLTPGVQVSALQDGTVDQRRGSFVVNGNRSTINNFLLDGLDNNSYQDANQGLNNQAVTESVDGIQQFTIITSNYPAEYGRAGGAIINVKTKSGSDTPHGSLHEFLRNTMFNAYGPFYGTGQKPALIQNQFGGSFGYKIPHVKDFFFFLDYEGFRSVTRTLVQDTIPDMNQRQGLLLAPTSTTNPTLIPVPVKNPLTGKQYLDGVIPSTDFTPFAAAVLAALPLPTTPSCLVVGPGNGCPGLTDNYSSTETGHNFRDIGDFRLDKYFGNRLQTFARVSKQSIHILSPPGIPGPAGGGGWGHLRILVSSGAAGATYVTTPNSVLDLRLGITFTNSGKKPYNEGTPNFFSPFNIPYPVPSNFAQSGLNTEPIYDFSTLGVEDSQNQYSSPQTYNLKGAYTVARGRHSFGFGYEWLHVNMILDPGGPLLGENQYDGLYSPQKLPAGTTLPDGTPQIAPQTSTSTKQAAGITDFIFGAQDDYSLANYTSPTVYYDYHFAYAEDSWKVRPRLTLTYGLRYEFATPQRLRGQRLSNFDPTTNAMILATPGSLYNEALVHPKLDDFAPRFGFAYSMYPNIVFRGGYGISFVQFTRNGNNIAINGPSVVDGAVTNQVITLPLCANNSQELLTCFRTTMQGFPSSLDSPAQYSTATTVVQYLPSHTAPAYLESYSLGTQVQMNPSTVLNMGFVGSHGVHVQLNADYNEASVQAPGQSLTLLQRRPIQNFEDISDYAAVGYLHYTALQAQITHRTAGGLYLMNSFTWSKAIDNGSGEPANGDSAYVSLRNIKYGNGRSGYDQRLNDSLGAVWKIPFGTRLRNRTLRQTVSGWTITTITRVTSGLPMNIYYKPDDNDLTSSTLGAYRPNYTGFLSTIVNPRSQWKRGNAASSTCTSICNVLNSSQLSVPTEAAAASPGQNDSPYGNMPRNALTGPNYFGVDLGLQKNFSLPDRMNLQFRCEAFDVMNHPNYKTPNTQFNNVNFGVLTSAYPSRQIQFALRLTF